jgi:CBS domain-containing protein
VSSPDPRSDAKAKNAIRKRKRKEKKMNVRKIMTTDITKATPENTLVYVATMMRDEDIGSLPIVDGNGLIGIITDRDIVIRAIADGKDPSTTKVEEVLSEELESVEPDTDVTDAADLMASRRIRRLPVVEDGQLVGMVSLGDIAIKHEDSTAAYALEGISEGVKTSSGDGSAMIVEQETKRVSGRATARPKKTKGHRKTPKKAA